MIARPGRNILRPWLLGLWLVATAWLTAIGLGSASLLPTGASGAAALGGWLLLTAAVHVTARRRRNAGRAAPSAQRLVAPLLVAATMLVITLILAPAMPLLARIGLVFAAGLIPASLLPLTQHIMRRSRWAAWGGAITHVGAALGLIGIACAAGLSSETKIVAIAGIPINVGSWLIDVQPVIPVAGPNFTAIESDVRATRGDGVSALRPQLRTAIAATTQHSVPAVATSWAGRLAIDLGQARGEGREISVTWMPFVSLLWLGGALMAVGGVISLAGLRGFRIAMVAAALATGVASYQLFASGGDPAAAPIRPSDIRPSLVEQRGAFLGQFHRSSHWLIISDSLAARGETRDAAGILQSATRQHPRDFALWLGLGNALTAHGRGLNPAARLAFARSAELAPTSPAPGYFLGLAKLQSGDRAGALAEWRSVLADAPADASWRPIVEDGVASIEGRSVPG